MTLPAAWMVNRPLGCRFFRRSWRFAVLHDDHRRILRVGVEGRCELDLGSGLRYFLERGLHVDGEVRLLRSLSILGDSQLNTVGRCRNYSSGNLSCYILQHFPYLSSIFG